MAAACPRAIKSPVLSEPPSESKAAIKRAFPLPSRAFTVYASEQIPQPEGARLPLLESTAEFF